MENLGTIKSTTSDYLWRYTSLPSALDILRTKQITFLSPNSWEDKNDIHFLNVYKARKEIQSLHAICFSGVKQTFHHWHVFAKGSDGVCLRMNRRKLLEIFEKTEGLEHGEVQYFDFEGARRNSTIDLLPYMKNSRYADEGEYRAIMLSKAKGQDLPKVKIELDIISRITLSPWLASSLEDSVKKTIQSIDGVERIEVKRSSITESSEWKKIADDVAPMISTAPAV